MKDKTFEPFNVFPQICFKGRLQPDHFGCKSIHMKDYGTEAERRTAENEWKKFLYDQDIVLPSKGRGGVTAIVAKNGKAFKDVKTNEIVLPLKPMVMPKGVSDWHWRLQCETPLTRPYDLARVFDAQGKALNPVAREPREDEKTTEGFMPAGAAELYVGYAMIIVAVNARGRVMIRFFTMDESDGEPKLRVAKWTDSTIPLLEAKLADPQEAQAMEARLGDGKRFMSQVRELFCLVSKEYSKVKGESDGVWHLRSKRERIADRACWKEREGTQSSDDTDDAKEESSAEGAKPTVIVTEQAVDDLATKPGWHKQPVNGSRRARLLGSDSKPILAS